MGIVPGDAVEGFHACFGKCSSTSAVEKVFDCSGTSSVILCIFVFVIFCLVMTEYFVI